MGYNKISSSCIAHASFLRSLPDSGHNPLSHKGCEDPSASAVGILKGQALRARACVGQLGLGSLLHLLAHLGPWGDVALWIPSAAHWPPKSRNETGWMLAFPFFLGGGGGCGVFGRRFLQVQVHPFNLSQLITQTRNPTAFCAVLAFYGDCPQSVGPLLAALPPSFLPSFGFSFAVGSERALILASSSSAATVFMPRSP